ncbi:MAG: LLM class flavin-dependent oxidoreductase [Acidimicrobiia bacterium]|nr:LLM class flavin-dependent oxidoreductase [Acidimicrobiia bacterium]
MPATLVGLQIIPTMPVGEVIETIQVAEGLGYDYCMVADEGFMHDVYTTLGAAAGVTDRIRLGAVTNGYTRHPAVAAAALATVNELSGGRAFVTLVAGGSMVLHPMGLDRTSPLAVMDDTIEMMRALWTGRAVTWQGRRFRLDGAQLSTGPHDIPIWVGARGERLLRLAGEKADGVVLMAKADLGDALDEVRRGGDRPTRIYLDRLAFTPEMIEEAKELYAYAIMDSPARTLGNLGIDDATIARMHQALESGGPAAVAPLVTDAMVAAYQIAGTRVQCRRALHDVVDVHRLDAFFVNIISPGLDANRELLGDVVDLIGPERR